MDCYKNAQLFLAVTAKWLFIYWQFCVSGQKEEGKSQWKWVWSIQTQDIPTSVLEVLYGSWGQHLEFYECFLSTLFSMPPGWQNGVKEKNGKAHFFLITFWNLRVVVIKTWRGLMRRNTDNKISFALFQIHTHWLITVVLSIKTLGYAWCAVHHMQCKAQYWWMVAEFAFFIKEAGLCTPISQLRRWYFKILEL